MLTKKLDLHWKITNAVFYMNHRLLRHMCLKSLNEEHRGIVNDIRTNQSTFVFVSQVCHIETLADCILLSSSCN